MIRFMVRCWYCGGGVHDDHNIHHCNDNAMIRFRRMIKMMFMIIMMMIAITMIIIAMLIPWPGSGAWKILEESKRRPLAGSLCAFSGLGRMMMVVIKIVCWWLLWSMVIFILIIFLQGGREVGFHIGGCTGGKDEIQMGIKPNINILYLYYSTQSKMIFQYLNIEYLHFSIS